VGLGWTELYWLVLILRYLATWLHQGPQICPCIVASCSSVRSTPGGYTHRAAVSNCQTMNAPALPAIRLSQKPSSNSETRLLADPRTSALERESVVELPAEALLALSRRWSNICNPVARATPRRPNSIPASHTLGTAHSSPQPFSPAAGVQSPPRAVRVIIGHVWP
jgi:hypothetical protein